MRQLLCTALAALAMTVPAMAWDVQVPGWKQNDAYLTPVGLKTRLSGHIVSFPGGEYLRFFDDDRFRWRETANDKGLYGRYAFHKHGLVCLYFDRGGIRCDTYVNSVGDIVMIDGNGVRHDIRSIVPGGSGPLQRFVRGAMTGNWQ